MAIFQITIEFFNAPVFPSFVLSARVTHLVERLDGKRAGAGCSKGG